MEFLIGVMRFSPNVAWGFTVREYYYCLDGYMRSQGIKKQKKALKWEEVEKWGWESKAELMRAKVKGNG